MPSPSSLIKWIYLKRLDFQHKYYTDYTVCSMKKETHLAKISQYKMISSKKHTIDIRKQFSLAPIMLQIFIVHSLLLVSYTTPWHFHMTHDPRPSQYSFLSELLQGITASSIKNKIYKSSNTSISLLSCDTKCAVNGLWIMNHVTTNSANIHFHAWIHMHFNHFIVASKIDDVIRNVSVCSILLKH